MKTIAQYRYANSSAQKIRLIANMIRGKKISNALEMLDFKNQKASMLVKKVLLSAIANAEHNNGMDIDKLKITEILINNGPSIKRIMPRAKGRADYIKKRTSHISIVLSDY